MATSNKDRVGKALDLVSEGLGPWIVDLLTRKYGPSWPGKVVQAAGGPPRGTDRKITDVSYLFWLFDKQWQGLFRDIVDFEDRRCISGLWDARNDWAHGSKFTDEQTERVLSDAEHLLRTVGAVEQADTLDAMRRDLRRIRYEKDQQQYRKAVEKSLSVTVDSAGLPSWRDVVEPHGDVARGEFELAQFAADMRLVAQGKAGPEYGDPTQFFERTYLTRGLRYLLMQTVRRLNGVGGEPVIDLMTTFGGGKTHSEIAVFHVGSGTPVDRMPGMREILDAAEVTSLPTEVSRAVIVGNDLSVQGSCKPDGTQVNTMWGEIAWQLGGKPTFDLVARFDEKGDPPPTSVLEDVLATNSPAIVLIDEWVAYLRQLYSRPETPAAGTFDAHMTFVQSLTEAVKAVPTAMLVASLPASDNVRDMGDGIVENTYEIGGTPGLEALRHLRSVIHRVESPWQPADIEESYEIVRRRIFKPLSAEAAGARDVTLQQFSSFYDKHHTQLPSEVRQPAYYDAMKAAYPIHPELFRRLYEDWSTLERFQRTRGVLRLMATVVHALWQSGDTAPLITPATIPLDDQKVFEEITTHLDENFKPIVDADIAGPSATATTIDREIPLLGRSMAARRVARCVFLGTAPAANRLKHEHTTGPVQGIETKRVTLGATYPGDNPAHLADALRVLADRGAYMNQDADRYWLSLQQSVQRLVRERAESYSQDEVDDELRTALRAETDRGIFDRVHRWPQDSGSVEDDANTTLVIFGTEDTHTRKAQSAAAEAADRYLQFRGSNARIHKNTLLFLAPDADRINQLHEALRYQLAWQYVLDNISALNLDQHNITVARNRRDRAQQTVVDQMREAYRWLLVPYQTPGDKEIDLETIAVTATHGTLVEQVTKKCEANELVLRSCTPALIRREIDKLNLWDREPHVPVERVTSLFTQYVYMPKVTSPAVVKTAIEHLGDVLLKDQDGFAYAEAIDKDGRYQGLTLENPSTVSNTGLLIKPEAAQTQIDAETPAIVDPPPGPGPTPPPGPGPTPPPTPPPTPNHRFHASKRLDPMRAVRDVAQLNDEILIHFTSNGVPVNITVDIDSDALAALPEDKRTVVEENLRSLGFDDWGVE